MNTNDLPGKIQRIVDVACDAFEEEWIQGGRPEIQARLNNMDPHARASLLEELLFVELQYRRQIGESPDVDEYTRQFPEDVSLIRRVFDEAAREASSDRSRRGDRHDHSDPLTGFDIRQSRGLQTGKPGGQHPPGNLESTRDTDDMVVRSRLRILRFHARGGLGEVSLAMDEDLRRHVALKEMRQTIVNDLDSRGRFVREAEITGRLEHPGVVPVYGLGQFTDGRPFYAMRFIQGDNLQEALQRFHNPDPNDSTHDPGERSVQFRELLNRFLDVCDAMSYAHSRGVLHRDLKPGNIILGTYGETLVVDWGLAKSMDGILSDAPAATSSIQGQDNESGTHTEQGQAIGTPQYMSPEQAAGNLAAMGPETDVYSLGAILYCLLTGRPPIDRGPLQTMLEHVQAGTWSKPHVLKPDVPPALESICIKALALRPEDRYSTVDSLASDVRRWLADQPVSVHRESFGERLTRIERRHRTLIRILGAAMAVITLISILATISVQRQRNRAVLASQESDRSRERAERVMKLLVSTFRRPDPNVDGRTITIAQVLDQAGKDVEAMTGMPSEQGALLDTIGQTYFGLGLLQEAQQSIEKALTIREQSEGKESLAVAESQNNLGTVVHSRGDIAKARRLYESALAFRLKQLGPNHRNTLATTNNLATAIREGGNPTEALAIFEDTLERQRQSLGKDDSETLVSANNLAMVYQDVGMIDKAIALYEETIPLASKKLGEEHVTTLLITQNLSVAYHESGNYAAAIALSERIAAQRREKLGPDHPHTLTTSANLANALRSAHHTRQAIELSLATLPKMESKLGEDHPYTLMLMNNLSMAYQDAHEFDKAIPLLEKVIAMRTHKLGDRHPDLLQSMNNLASAYHAVGRTGEAVPLLERTIALQTETLGPDHRHTLTSLYSLGIIKLAIGHTKEAIDLWELNLSRRRFKLGDDHPSTIATMSALSNAYRTNGDIVKAVTIAKEAVQRSRLKLGDEHYDTLHAILNLAESYRTNGDNLQAISLLEEVARVAMENNGAEDKQRMAALNNLALAYQDTGRLSDAIPLFEEVEMRRKKDLGEDHPDTWTAMHNLARAYQQSHQIQQAISLFEKTIEARSTHLSKEHAGTLMSLGSLAMTYRDGGQFEKAKETLESTLEVMTRVLGEKHPITLQTANFLGLVLLDLQQTDRSLELLEKTLESRRSLLRPNHPSTLASMHNLALAYLAVNRASDAATLLEAAIAERQKELGSEHPDTLMTLQALAEACLRTSRVEEGIVKLKQVAEAWRRRGSLRDPLVGEHFYEVAGLLLEAGAYADADSLAKEALRILPETGWRYWAATSLLGNVKAAQQLRTEAAPLLLQGMEGLQRHADAVDRPPLRVTLAAIKRLVDFSKEVENTEELAKWQEKLDAIQSLIDQSRIDAQNRGTISDETK